MRVKLNVLSISHGFPLIYVEYIENQPVQNPGPVKRLIYKDCERKFHLTLAFRKYENRYCNYLFRRARLPRKHRRGYYAIRTYTRTPHVFSWLYYSRRVCFIMIFHPVGISETTPPTSGRPRFANACECIDFAAASFVFYTAAGPVLVGKGV